MNKYIAIAALALTLGVAAKPANAGYAYTAGVPVGVKIAVFAVGAMTMSVMIQAIIVSYTQKRQLTLEEGQYAALLPFRTVHPLALPAKKRR